MSNDELFEKALSFATIKHMNQTRLDGSPYIYHPIEVAKLVKNAGYGLKYQITAILHDTLEDTNATEEEIAEFGEDVLNAVKLLTKTKDVQKEDYINNILANDIASVVKNADRISNVWECIYNGVEGTKRTDKFSNFANRYIDETKKYFYGKFSKALDDTIEKAENVLANIYIKKKEYPSFSCDDMKIYVKEKEVIDCEQPDINNKDFVLLYNNNDNNYYGAYFNNESFEYYKSWQLKDKTWKVIDNSILDDCEDGLIEIDKNTINDILKTNNKNIIVER